MKMNVVLERLESMGPGDVVCAVDFADVTSLQNANSQLSRLCRAGKVERLMRGIYRIADRSESRAGGDSESTPVDAMAVASAIARSNHWTIALDGPSALETFGLAELGPAYHGFASSGPSMAYDCADTRITFHHVADRFLGALSEASRPVVQALREIGRDGDLEPLAHSVVERMSQSDIVRLARESASLPPWMAAFAERARALKERQVRNLFRADAATHPIFVDSSPIRKRDDTAPEDLSSENPTA